MTKIKIFCTDLDGTLLHSDKTISEYSLSVLRKMSENGTIIIPVTGRHLAGIPEDIIKCGVNYAICSNGAGLFDFRKNKYIKEEIVNNQTALKLLDIFEELDIMADIFTSDAAYTDARNLNILNDIDASDAVKNYIKKSRIITESVKNFTINQTPSIHKITINFRKLPDGTLKNREKIKDILSDFSELMSVTGGSNNLEITNCEATKGKCIKFLSELTNIPLSEIAAIGDTENDISILKTVGFSIAMKNADSILKNICKLETEYDNDNDGAAKFMEKLTF